MPNDLPRLLGVLGYPGFAHLAAAGESVNPADVVLAALRSPSVPARVVEALPWVFITFADLDWSGLVDQVKLLNVQNRLGFLVDLARQVAEQRGQSSVASRLRAVEAELETARLADDDTLGRALTNVERAHLQQHRSVRAKHWNLLTSLRVEDLRWIDASLPAAEPPL
jgi:hypothetical protein